MRPDAGAEARRDMVCLSLEPWDDVHRRLQLVLTSLLRAYTGLRVLFVEPPVDIPASLARGRFAGPGSKLRRLEPAGRLWALRTTKWLPRVAGPWVDRHLRRQVLDAVHSLALTRPTLWVNDQAYAPLVEATGWPSVYDVTDDWLVAGAPERELRRRRRNDSSLLEHAGEVVVCSAALADRRGRERRVHLVPNAVDTDLLRSPAPRPADLAEGPVLVYAGTLHADRLDIELCVELGKRLSGRATLVLVGPNALDRSSARRLETEAGALLLGARPYGDVPAYLQHADVVVVPHLVTPFTESLDPIKAYEARAVARRVVATPVAGFRDLGPPVVVAERARFVDEVAACLSEAPIPPGPGPLRAPPPSWDDRARELWEIFERVRNISTPPSARRVTFADHCARMSGAEIALARTLPALGGLQCRVVLAEQGPLASRLGAEGIQVEVLELAGQARDLPRRRVAPGWKGLRAAASSFTYACRLSRHVADADLLVTNSLKSALYGGLAGRMARVPVVWHLNDRVAPDYLRRTAVTIVRVAARLLPSAVVANSDATLSTLCLSSRTSKRLHASAVGAPCPPATLTRRENDGGLVVGMVGRLAPWKGQSTFLEAFASAFPGGDECAVVVGGALFGETGYASSLHQLAHALGLDGRVRFTGHVDQVGPELSLIDVLVHASATPEPFGQVVVEGMAAGLPVVAASGGGIDEVVTDGTDGLLYPPGDTEALARLLRMLAAEPGLRRRLGEAARASSARFAPEMVARELETTYGLVTGWRR